MVAVATTDDLEKTVSQQTEAQCPLATLCVSSVFPYLCASQVYYIDVYVGGSHGSRLGRGYITHHMLSDPSQSGCLDLPIIGVEGSVVGSIAGVCVCGVCVCVCGGVGCMADAWYCYFWFLFLSFSPPLPLQLATRWSGRVSVRRPTH